MKNKSPTVSIVIPAYNEGNNIVACVNSLKAQDFSNSEYEIIVADNNSTDNTLDLVKDLGVRYTVENTKGPAAAKNAGISMAQGDIIAFVDGDCVAARNWLTTIVAGFQDPEVGCVAGAIRPMEERDSSPLQQFLIQKQYLAQAQHIRNPFLPFAAAANAAYRQAIFYRIGLFDKKLLIGEDTDLSWRMQLFANYRVHYAPDAIVFHPYESERKALFRQKRRHACGSVLLYKKYKKYWNQREHKTLKQVYWEYTSIIRRWVSLIHHRLIDKGDGSPVDEHQLLLETAWKVGLLQGSLRHVVWYV